MVTIVVTVQSSAMCSSVSINLSPPPTASKALDDDRCDPIGPAGVAAGRFIEC